MLPLPSHQRLTLLLVVLQLPCDSMLEDVAGNVRRATERLACRAVWRAGESHPVTEESVWPNPESQAWARLSADRWMIQDPTPPPELYPELAAAMAERQRHYSFLAGAMAKYGDCSPNTTMRMSPARIGHLQRWAAIPWCDVHDGGAGQGGEHGEATTGGRSITVSLGGSGADQPARAPRRLIGFAGGACEIERLRKEILFGCC